MRELHKSDFFLEIYVQQTIGVRGDGGENVVNCVN